MRPYPKRVLTNRTLHVKPTQEQLSKVADCAITTIRTNVIYLTNMLMEEEK